MTATVDEDIGTELITRAQASSNTGGPSFGSNLLNFGVISRFYSITYANALSLDFGWIFGQLEEASSLHAFPVKKLCSGWRILQLR